MIDVDSFLAGVAESRSRAQTAARSAEIFPAEHCDLPSALDLILGLGGFVQPQLARSPFAGPGARVGVPSRERAQVQYWWRCFGAEANWLLDPQASGMLVLEFSPYISPYRLFRRAGEYDAFERTLRYQLLERRFALFSIPPGRQMSRGWYGGVHWRTPVLIPPSRVLGGPDGGQELEVSYIDPSAPLLPAFETLLGPPVRPF